MPTRRQLQNLKRGGIRGSSESAARARAAKEAHREADEALASLASSDPYAAYGELLSTMTRLIVRHLRIEERTGGKPSRKLRIGFEHSAN